MITQIQSGRKYGARDEGGDAGSSVGPSTQATAVEITPAFVDSGRSKRKRIPRQLADALNGCLCGLVLDCSMDGVLRCNQAGCETQWVSTVPLKYDYSLPYVFSTTFNVLTLSRNPEIGYARLVRRLEKGNACRDRNIT